MRQQDLLKSLAWAGVVPFLPGAMATTPGQEEMPTSTRKVKYVIGDVCVEDRAMGSTSQSEEERQKQPGSHERVSENEEPFERAGHS